MSLLLQSNRRYRTYKRKKEILREIKDFGKFTVDEIFMYNTDQFLLQIQ